MQKSYCKCKDILEKTREILSNENDIKKGKLYFTWIKNKTEKLLNEKNENYVYENLINNTLKNYKIDIYNYERVNKKIKDIVNRNYVLKNNNYIFYNTYIPKFDAMLIVEHILLKRGNVVWIDFGFNIGKEFGGMHPAVILKKFDDELFVLPITSKKPKEYKKLEQEYDNGKITFDELKRRKSKITEIIQLDYIYRFKDMTRWANITRMKKVSIMRLNFNGTIGKIAGAYMDEISKKIKLEF